MKRKKYIPLLLMVIIPEMLSAQFVLKKELHLPRPGDEIIKQQVEYKDPGRSGENVIWDFSQLSSINDEYPLVYSSPYPAGDSVYIMGFDTIPVSELADDYLFIGTEHYTMYYYRFTGNCLWTLGHENAATILQYHPPLPAGVFPMKYGDSHAAAYGSRGLYSGSVPFETAGNMQITADAYGMMILPSGDTLKQVIRTQSLKTFSEHLLTEAGDSVTVNTRTGTCRWYSKGYRYPIFETIRNIVYRDSTETNRFETSFFYPPQDHYYLEDDAENLALLDGDTIENPVDPWAGLNYNFYPNPVTTFVNIELYLPRTTQVKLQLRTQAGFLLLNENKGSLPQGLHHLRLDLPALTTGNYVLTILLDDYPISEAIMKR